ncbi:ABC transporter permease [Intestinibacillus sp. Marseille-P6563]|uniref:ABC transporter permease n=1 Tax=Intestinibacillus sp. Marseille-P6563 TaxID=2364792 RepID=UPI000F051808|nr:ABC transporter permease [Intestinibacillus sp. Marseille-P6563]
MKKLSIKSMSNTIVVLAALVVLCIALSLASPYFATKNNLINIVLQAAINATLACGMTFVILTGGIDLSVGSIVAFAGILLGVMLKAEIPLAMALLGCVLIGGICGLVNGLLVTRINLPPFISTLGMMSIARGGALYIADGRAISGFSGKLNYIGSGTILGIPVMILIMALTFLIGLFVLKFTRAGRYIYAIGGNVEATRLSGINTNRYTTLVYVICGLTAGLAAVLLTSRLDSAQPVAGEGYELDAIAATVIGGTSLSGGEGKLSGTIIGALIIAVLNNGLNLLNVSSYIQQIVIGLVIILAVTFDRIRSK